jgi:hypothetical protein
LFVLWISVSISQKVLLARIALPDQWFCVRSIHFKLSRSLYAVFRLSEISELSEIDQSELRIHSCVTKDEPPHKSFSRISVFTKSLSGTTTKLG